jgi:hypothetical protein
MFKDAVNDFFKIDFLFHVKFKKFNSLKSFFNNGGGGCGIRFK